MKGPRIVPGTNTVMVPESSGERPRAGMRGQFRGRNDCTVWKAPLNLHSHSVLIILQVTQDLRSHFTGGKCNLLQVTKAVNARSRLRT